MEVAARARRPVRCVAASVLPAVFAIFIGTLLIAWLLVVPTGMPGWWSAR